MRSAEGAIEGVVLGEEVQLQIISGNVPPRRMSGSGLVDVVAQLRLAGLLDASGRLKTPEQVPGHPLVGRLVVVDVCVPLCWPREHLIAVRSGRPDRRKALQHLGQRPGGAAIAVHDDDTLVLVLESL